MELEKKYWHIVLNKFDCLSIMSINGTSKKEQSTKNNSV
jgi:hypothetical protein